MHKATTPEEWEARASATQLAAKKKEMEIKVTMVGRAKRRCCVLCSGPLREWDRKVLERICHKCRPVRSAGSWRFAYSADLGSRWEYIAHGPEEEGRPRNSYWIIQHFFGSYGLLGDLDKALLASGVTTTRQSTWDMDEEEKNECET